MAQGRGYLKQMQHLAFDPSLVELRVSQQWEEQICRTIGRKIASINENLVSLLDRCQNCFYPEQRLPIQIFATPFAPHLKIDALCNLEEKPITILIDVGRIIQPHWLNAVAHEYAHAQIGIAGHHPAFCSILTHLCLGLALPSPPPQGLSESQLQNWPPCQPTPDPLQFWLRD